MQRPLGITIIAFLLRRRRNLSVDRRRDKANCSECDFADGWKQIHVWLRIGGTLHDPAVRCGYALIGWGIFRLHNWARWAAMAVMVVGVASLVPEISMAELGAPVLWYGLQIALRVAVGWYLAQAPAVVDSFRRD